MINIEIIISKTERLTTFLVKYLEILAFRLLDHKGSWWLNLFSALIDYVVAMQLQSHGSVLPNPFLDLWGRIFVFHKKTRLRLYQDCGVCWGL